MTARPIPFRAPMVRAILEGRKTMTRRVLKDQPQPNEQIGGGVCDPIYSPESPYFWLNGHDGSIQRPMMKAPHYLPGDTLWVREAWRLPAHYDDALPSEAWCWEGHPPRRWHFEADGAAPNWTGRYRHARFMPRWASRIDLRVTAVRVERLQEISEEDAMAEGVFAFVSAHMGSPRDAFAALWQLIHGPDAWDENPWVAAMSFERIQP